MMTQEAFLDTLMTLQPALQLAAEKMLHSETDAEDVVQETVVELWEKREKMNHVVNLNGYAMQSLKNRCVSLLRKRHELSAEGLDGLEELSDEAVRAEAAAIEEKARMLDDMMEQLPRMQREAVRMKYIDRLSHEEMQRRLGMTSSNVYTTLSRAVSSLKSMVKQ